MAAQVGTARSVLEMRALLESMGVDDYEPRVLHQLLEFVERYCTDIFADSAQYAEHAGRSGRVQSEDVQLSSRLRASASQPQASQFMTFMAQTRNRERLEKLHVPNIQLPNPELCLVKQNWQYVVTPTQAPTSTSADAPAAQQERPSTKKQIPIHLKSSGVPMDVDSI